MKVYDLSEDSLENKYIPLSFLLTQVKNLISYNLNEPMWIRAEISNVKTQGINKHYYFEITERNQSGKQIAKINANCWKQTAEKIIPPFEKSIDKKISAGIVCDFYVKINYDEVYGLSLNILNIRSAWTVGEHEKKKILIRKNIERLGISNLQKLKTSPTIITSIAILSPSSAAGLGDFVSEAKKWNASGVIKIHPYVSIFEGENTENSIVDSLNKIKKDNSDFKKINNYNKFDLVIILRGGGAKSSLAFLDEFNIIKTMLEIDIPVWTAIGHEEDFGLLDEYSCKNFHTPSKSAAEIWGLLKNEVSKFEKNTTYLKSLIDIKIEKIINEIESKKNIVKIKAINKVEKIEQFLTHTIEKAKLTDPMSILHKGYVALFDENNKLIKKEEDLINKNKIIIKTHYGVFEININNINKIGD